MPLASRAWFIASIASSIVSSGMVSVAVTVPAALMVMASEAALTLLGSSNSSTMSYSPKQKK